MALVRPKDAFVPNGRPWLVLGPSDILNADDPLVREFPDFFEPVAATWRSVPDSPAEQTTANPGELRAVRRGR